MATMFIFNGALAEASGKPRGETQRQHQTTKTTGQGGTSANDGDKSAGGMSRIKRSPYTNLKTGQRVFD